jgi:hypothetical protein
MEWMRSIYFRIRPVMDSCEFLDIFSGEAMIHEEVELRIVYKRGISLL